MPITTLAELIDYLHTAVDRAESPDWVALHLTVEEAEELLPDLETHLHLSDMAQDAG